MLLLLESSWRQPGRSTATRSTWGASQGCSLLPLESKESHNMKMVIFCITLFHFKLYFVCEYKLRSVRFSTLIGPPEPHTPHSTYPN